MDRQSLCRLSRLSRAGGGDRRIQRQVQCNPDGRAWRLRGDTGRPHALDLSELLPAGRTVDVRWSSSGGGSAMNGLALVLDRAEADGRAEFREAVLAGLARTPRAIPAKFLYDARGSALFDQICELPEYYLTRTETGILRQCVAELAALAGPGCALVEFGSGSSVKSRLLLEGLRDLSAYVPIDISRQHLDATAARLRRDYPGLNVQPVCADYMALTELPAEVNGAPRLGFFPGSTIGNLEPAEATAFLRRARSLLGPTGALVMGVDLKKDPRRLHDAYNDPAR